jgi:hypothetical protein
MCNQTPTKQEVTKHHSAAWLMLRLWATPNTKHAVLCHIRSADLLLMYML